MSEPPSHAQVPLDVVNGFMALETTVRDVVGQINDVLYGLDVTRQRYEDATVQQKLISDRLAEEQIQRIKAEAFDEPSVIQCVAAVEQAARQVINLWDNPDPNVDGTLDIKTLSKAIHELDLARKRARDTATAGSGPL